MHAAKERHALICTLLFVLSLAMMVAYIRWPPILMLHMERLTFQGETLFSFPGRVVADLIIVFGLVFFAKKYFPALVTAAIIGAVIKFKDEEYELFEDVFQSPDNNSGGASENMGGNSGYLPVV